MPAGDRIPPAPSRSRNCCEGNAHRSIFERNSVASRGPDDHRAIEESNERIRSTLSGDSVEALSAFRLENGRLVMCNFDSASRARASKIARSLPVTNSRRFRQDTRKRPLNGRMPPSCPLSAR